MEKDRRIGWIDIAKGIGIILIVLGHSSQGIVRQIIYSFHVPLFFILSGYTVKDDKYTPAEILIKRIKQLLPYYAVCGITIISLTSIKCAASKEFFKIWETVYAFLYGSGSVHETPFYIANVGPVWFLLAMIWADYFYFLFSKKSNPGLYYLGLFALGLATSKLLWLPFSIQSGMTSTIFIYIGKCFRNKEAPATKRIQVPALMAALWINCIFLQEKWVLVVENRFPNYFIDVVGAACGAYIVMLCSFYLQRGRVSNVLSYIGKSSLVILCLHTIKLVLIPWRELLHYIGVVHYQRPLVILLKIIFIAFGLLIYNFLRRLFCQQR